MARPRDEELDQKIIQSAADEFHQNGYGPMTLASVAKRAGVRPGAVYTRFRDKKEILVAILEHVSKVAESQTKLRVTDDPYDDLVFAVRETHNSVSALHAFTIPALAIMDTDEANEVRDLIRDDMTRNRHMQLIRPALERLKEAGLLSETIDVNYASAMLVGAYFTFRLALDPSKWPTDMPEKLVANLGIVKP
jgi:AcrR family transcriptional regulator